MPGFPLPDDRRPREVISPWSELSIGGMLGAAISTIGVGTVYPAANRALFIPFILPRAWLVTQAVVGGGSTTGNCDLGVYDHAGNRLVSSGSVAKQTNAETVANLTDTLLLPGSYYMAIAADGVQQYVAVAPAQIGYLQAMGMKQMATAFVLPATATFATVATSFVPVMALWGTSL